MAEVYVKRYKFTETSTQTDDLYFSLTEKKTARMYYSQAYKEKVLSLKDNTGMMQLNILANIFHEV